MVMYFTALEFCIGLVWAPAEITLWATLENGPYKTFYYYILLLHGSR